MKHLIAGILAIIVGTVLLLFAFGGIALPTRNAPIAVPSPTLLATPTPVRPLSAVATTSAFVTLESFAASVSAQIQAAQTQDPSLVPPTLDLPLGYDTL